ncbi:hypothetical protein MMC25_004217 [Agyrium rufum]|nr:hypothetical protein [Agyrium rufum]
MPYTPPAQHSPVASQPQSPVITRSPNSYFQANRSSSPGFQAGPRPGLPRSASSTSYLHKHRRSPSLTKTAPSSANTHTPDPSPPSSVNASRDSEKLRFVPNENVRQSPPPVNNLVIPTGAIISPPESTQNSSDDEEVDSRGRPLELDSLAELQAAIRTIEQQRESSPETFTEGTDKARDALGVVLKASNSQQISGETPAPVKALTQQALKIAHSRSNTECLQLTTPIDRQRSDSSSRSTTDSENEDDTQMRKKPPMLRKKSGELVRPALRPPSARRRPSSMPGTPTYGKAVHFDSHLEHVRHFLQVDRPLAVSAGSSPAGEYEDQVEFPFGHDDRSTLTPPFEWEIKLGNFPAETPERLNQPIRVEKVFLSKDNKHLIGSVAVANLAFHKLVVARFTLDYWKTTSEVVAEYSNDIRHPQANDGIDRFNFEIKLADQANLENKTLFFCVRYNVNGQELWDSNNNMNFQVDFTKKALPQLGKQGMKVAASKPLPRSQPSPPVSSGRPVTAPASFDDFADGFENNFTFGGFKLSGDPAVRLKKPNGPTWPQEPPQTRGRAPAQPFGNRYDFGASLSAAIQAASNAMEDDEKKASASQTLSARTMSLPFTTQAKKATSNPATTSSTSGRTAAKATTPTIETPAVTGATLTTPSKPAALKIAEKPTLQSQSYNELLDKYCFFGSAKALPSPVLAHHITASPPSSVTVGAAAASSRQLDGSEAGFQQQTDGPSDTPKTSMMSVMSSGVSSPPSFSVSVNDSLRFSSPPSSQSSSASNSGRPSRAQSRAPSGNGLSAFGTRAASPGGFGYPYPQSMHDGFFSGVATQTAIHG